MDILELLEYEEGYREKPYYCSEGFPTIGIGKKIGPKNAPLKYYDFTVSRDVAKAWLNDKVFCITCDLAKLDWFSKLSVDKRIIIVSMAYQIGVSGLLKFKRMISALSAGDYEVAAIEAKDSLWYRQTKKRADRHCRVLAGESIADVYRK